MSSSNLVKIRVKTLLYFFGIGILSFFYFFTFSSQRALAHHPGVHPTSTSAQARTCAAFPRDLKQGASGADVSELQRFFTDYPNLYPEKLTTGFYGEATKRAIQRFQLKHGIVSRTTDSEFGNAGLKTRQALQVACPATTLSPQSFNTGFSTALATYKNSPTSQNLSKLKTVALDRKSKLKEFLLLNPRKAHELKIFQETVTSLPPEVQTLVEQEITLTGNLEIEHADYFDLGLGVEKYSVETNEGKRYRTTFAGAPPRPAPRTSPTVELTGIVLDDTLAVTEDGSSLVAPQATSEQSSSITLAADVSTSSYAVILLNFPIDAPTSTVTPEFHTFVMNQVNTYYNEISYGRKSISYEVFGWYTALRQLPDPTGYYGCTYTNIFSEAIKVADPDIDFQNFDGIIIITPPNGSCNAYSATVGRGLPKLTQEGSFDFYTVLLGGSNVEFMDQFAGTISHEIGHNLGVGHAGYVHCGETAPLLPDLSMCEVRHSSDNFDVMGNRLKRGHMNAYHKNEVGFFSSTNVESPRESGVYRIAILEIATSSVQALQIPRGDGTSIWVEYRQPIGFDAILAALSIVSIVYDGVQIRIALPPIDEVYVQSPDTLLVDARPEDFFTYEKAAFRSGDTFIDPVSRIQIIPHRFTETFAEVNVVLPTPLVTDLYPQSTKITPSRPTDSRAVSLIARVGNQGDAALASQTTLRIDNGNNGSWDTTLSGRTADTISSGGRYTHRFTLPILSAGIHKYQLCVDVGDEIIETNESNNCVEGTFTVENTYNPPLGTDLYVTAPRLSPAKIKDGKSVTAQARVSNQGYEYALSSRTTLRIFNDVNGTIVDKVLTENTAPLTYGDRTTHSWSKVLIAQAGVKRYEICADSTNQVPESDETNNCIYHTFVVSGVVPETTLSAFSSTIPSGSSGADINLLQQFLDAESHFDPASDGFYDPATVQAVKDFQSEFSEEILTPQGLTAPTGIFDELTKRKANELISLYPQPTSTYINLLSNPSFEEENVNWTAGEAWGPNKVVTQETATDGRSSAKFIFGPRDSRSAAHAVIAADAGRTYRISADLKTQNVSSTGGMKIEFQWRTSGGTLLRTDLLGPVKGTLDWKTYSKDVTPPTNTKRLTVRLVADRGTGIAYLDNVRVEIPKVVITPPPPSTTSTIPLPPPPPPTTTSTTPSVPLLCAATTSSVPTNTKATFTVSGGIPPYLWSAPSGTPLSLATATPVFTVSYATPGTSTVTVLDSTTKNLFTTRRISCSIMVTAPPPPPPPPATLPLLPPPSPTPPPPASPPTPAPLSCTPKTQTVIQNQPTTFTAVGGLSPFLWSSPSGTPAFLATSSRTYVTAYASPGTYEMGVLDSTTNNLYTTARDTCTVTVTPQASAPSLQELATILASMQAFINSLLEWGR